MRFDCYSFGRPLLDVGDLARQAERIGFDGLWFTESNHNPFLLSAVAAMATERLDVGTGIAVALARSPMVTAQATWDLAQASRGRFILGLGSQVKAHIERRFSMPWSSPAARMREYVEALRAIFAAFQGTERLRFDGDFYHFSLLTEFFNSGASPYGNVAIYLSGVNPMMARVSGEVADGIHVHPVHSPRYLREVLRPAVAAGAAARGRPLEDIVFAVPVFIVTGDGEAEIEAQRSLVRKQLAFYASTPAYHKVLELHGWGDAGEELSRLQRAGRAADMPGVVTDEMLDAFSVTATWDDLGDGLRTRYDGLADRLFPYGTAGDWQERPELIERWAAVAARVKEAK